MRVSAGEGIIYFVWGGCGNIFVFPRRSLLCGPLNKAYNCVSRDTVITTAAYCTSCVVISKINPIFVTLFCDYCNILVIRFSLT